MVMSVFGGMSKGERNRIKLRGGTDMAAQTLLEAATSADTHPTRCPVVLDSLEADEQPVLTVEASTLRV